MACCCDKYTRNKTVSVPGFHNTKITCSENLPPPPHIDLKLQQCQEVSLLMFHIQQYNAHIMACFYTVKFYLSLSSMWELRSGEFKRTFILASALVAMRSIYIGQLLRPAAAPLIVCMRVRLGGVAIMCDYPHPASRSFNSSNCLNESIAMCMLIFTYDQV